MAARPSYAAAAHHESFRHETLRLSENSVRLFQVQAGPVDSVISLRITQYSIQKRPPYKAISYTWGTSENSHPILVNGRYFSLHPNLWNLLFHLRQRKETSFLWADRLCIDQENLAERNFHVQLMGKIYEQANTVIIWLGLPSPDRTEIRAMDFVKEIAAFRQTQPDSSIAKTYMTKDQEHRWETLLRMCRHAYWTRTWIIQEFLRASSLELVCGKASMDWNLFDSLLMVLQQPMYSNVRVVSTLLQTRPVRLSLRRHASDASTLIQLLREYHDSMCTERRDKIYGILGLASDCIDLPGKDVKGIRPDYQKHIIHVYLDALQCIESTIEVRNSVASAANLVCETLMLTPNDISDYVSRMSDTPSMVNPIYLTPAYVGVVQTVVSPWTSVSNLKQKLEALEWGDYVGYEMRAMKAANRRRSLTRVTHASLPEDLLRNVINAAELEPELAYLHNYPQVDGMRVPAGFIAKSTMDKRHWDNPSLQRPSVIVEQCDNAPGIRLGFACTNVRRGDLVLQFSGLNFTLIMRQLGADLLMVGKAVMITHSEIDDQILDPVCSSSPWYSACPSYAMAEPLHIESDALSMAELLSRT